MRVPQPRRRSRIFGAGVAITGLLAGSATAAVAQDADDEPLVICSVDDDVALLGEEVSCEAIDLVPGEDFFWELDYVALDPSLGAVDDPDALTDEQFEEFGEVVGGAQGESQADGTGRGTFSFVIPEDLDIGFMGLFDGVVQQDETGDAYEEYFGGLIIGDVEFDLADLACAPEPAVPGARVSCEAEDAPGAAFDWAVLLLDLEDLAELEAGADLEEYEDFEDVDLDELLAELEALEEFEAIDDLEDVLAEGTGTVDEDGVLSYAFELPEDTTAVAYITVSVTEEALGFYLGEIGEPVEDSSDGVSPGVEADDDTAAAPVSVPRPTRVDTGAGGTAERAPAAVGGWLLALGLLAMVAAAPAWRRRSTV